MSNDDDSYSRPRTSRGLRLFLREQGGGLRVQEAAPQGGGAHALVLTDSGQVQLSVGDAELVIEALRAFVAEAYHGGLSEPARNEKEVK